MKKIIYLCDQCHKELAGTELENKKHIRILRAEIRENKTKFIPIINSPLLSEKDGLHFCNEKCLAKFFKEKLNAKSNQINRKKGNS